MKPSVNRSDSANTKVLSKREGKKQINIAWNPKIVFQLALIAAMLLVFFVMNVTIEVDAPQKVSKPWVFDEPPVRDYDVEPDNSKPKASKPSKPRDIAKKQPRVIQNVINVLPDDAPEMPEDDLAHTDMPTAPGISTPTTTKVEVSKGDAPINTMKTVEFVPVFPGCERLEGNFAKQACMSEKIGRFIVNRFRTDKFDDKEFSGKQKIYVQFTIDKNGVVTDVLANAVHESLKNEAIRVVSTLPDMIPGIQGNSPVPVRYRIPIAFQFE